MHPRLTSASAPGVKIRLTFVNHARHPVRIFHVPHDDADSSSGLGSGLGSGLRASPREVDMGSLRAYGAPLTFHTRDTHAWVVRSWGGVTLLEVPPRAGRRSGTIDVHECELRASQPGAGLHHGWR